MMFCPKCGSILLPKMGKNKKKVLACSCGYTNKDTDSIKMREKVAKAKEIEIVDEDVDIKILPKVNEECPKCKHDTAYFWTLQTRAGDEPETRFFKCEKCKHTWREY